jgi:hypothetical protein
MALPTVPPSDPRSTDPQFPGGLAKINPAGLQDEDLQRIRDVTDKGIADLEARYKEPNYFKVAAGFAKPQLGGFLASLGSASEAMAENVEQQRENILPVTNLKVQRELANTLLGQKIKQRDIYNKWLESGRPIDERIISSITSLGPDTEIGQTAKRFLEDAQRRTQLAGTSQELADKFPTLQKNMSEAALSLTNPDATPEQNQAAMSARDANLNKMRPPGFSESQWAALNTTDKIREGSAYANIERNKLVTEEAALKTARDQADPILQSAGVIRSLALGEGLEDRMVNGKMLNGAQQMSLVLGAFGGNQPFDFLVSAANDGKFGSTLKDIELYVARQNLDPKSRTVFEKLVKELAAQQVNFASTQVNPTDVARSIIGKAQPNISNSQMALVGIMDAIAFKARNDIENYQYVASPNVDKKKLGIDPIYLRKRADQNDYLIGISSGNIQVGMNRPWWYDLKKSAPEKQAEGSQPIQPSRPSGSETPAGSPKPAGSTKPTGSLWQQMQDRFGPKP